MVDESPKRLPVKTEDHLPRVGIALVEIVSAERFLEKKKQEKNKDIRNKDVQTWNYNYSSFH